MGCGLILTEHDLAQIRAHNGLLERAAHAFDHPAALARLAGTGNLTGLPGAVALLSEVARSWTGTLGTEFGEPVGVAVAAVMQASLPVDYTHQQQGIDGILHNPVTGRFTVVEVKTRSTETANFKLDKGHGHTQLSDAWTKANLEIMRTDAAYNSRDKALAEEVLQAMTEDRVDFVKIDVDTAKGEVRAYDRTTSDAQGFQQVSGIPFSQLEYI